MNQKKIFFLVILLIIPAQKSLSKPLPSYFHVTTIRGNKPVIKRKHQRHKRKKGKGISALQSYLSKHVNYPVAARNNGIEGLVKVSFVVDEQGNVTDVKIIKDIGYGCGEAVVKAIRNMPKWTPAKDNGTPVKSHFTVPFSFALN